MLVASLRLTYEFRSRYVLAIKDRKLAMFDRIENLKREHFVVGLRVLEHCGFVAGWMREGD